MLTGGNESLQHLRGTPFWPSWDGARYAGERTMEARYDEFWAEFLGIEPSDWSTRGVSVQAHVGLRGYRGFWCFIRHGRTVVSAPPTWLPRLRDIASGCAQDQLMAPHFWAAALGEDFEGAIGPAFHGCLEPARLATSKLIHVRQIELRDDAAVEQFRSECSFADWSSSGLDKAELWRQACFTQGKIAALGGYRSWSDGAGDPCILTHAGFRGSGRGAAVAGAVVALALANGKLPLFQTLESNHAAVRLARSLGYESYASHVAVRLKRDSPC